MWSFLLDWYSKFINKHPNHNENNVSFEFRGTDSSFWWKLQTSYWFFSGAACRPSTSFVEDAMYRIEIIKDMSRCFCLTKPRTGLPHNLIINIFIFPNSENINNQKLLYGDVCSCLSWFSTYIHQSFGENRTIPIARALFTRNDVEKNEAVLV